MQEIHLIEGNKKLKHQAAEELFQKIYQNYQHKFIFESKDVSPIYGRLSLIGVDPILQISGKNDRFSIKVLNQRGKKFLHSLTEEELSLCDSYEASEDEIKGQICKSTEHLDESQRSKRKNISQIIRLFLNKFKLEEKTFLGLYGAFSYDFVRLFEDLNAENPDNDTPDFNLFLYDTFIFFDHLKENTEIIVFREGDNEIHQAIQHLENQINSSPKPPTDYQITNPEFKLSKEQYMEMVEASKDYFAKGELFEVVFSNILESKFEGDPFSLYLKYRDVNPSPYLYFFDFGEDSLVGASPEMMIRCEHNIVQLRPISGTAKRGKDPIEDHENMLSLLASEKERSELDMLIDLGRNDLSRVCKPGINISDYRFVEKYSAVMHTVAHLTGELEEGNTALDALIAALNAGTLTGAPKVAAMNTIEKHESERRGYYGGTIGYLTFGGDMDSGIIIRTAHIKDDKLRFQVGATLLYDSVPEHEYQETINKAQAFLNTFQQ